MPPGELQDFLWQDFFSDTTQWWDNRRSKPTPWHPDFKHKKSKAALWVNNRHKPAWVDWQLVTWDPGVKRPPESARGSVKGQEAFAVHEGVAMCRKLCDDGKTTDCVGALNLLVQRGCNVPSDLFYRVLKRCIANKDLVLGRRIHALTVESGYEGDAFLATHLVAIYSSHGMLEKQCESFLRSLLRMPITGLPSSLRMLDMERLPKLYDCTDRRFGYREGGPCTYSCEYREARHFCSEQPT